MITPLPLYLIETPADWLKNVSLLELFDPVGQDTRFWLLRQVVCRNLEKCPSFNIVTLSNASLVFGLVPIRLYTKYFCFWKPFLPKNHLIASLTALTDNDLKRHPFDVWTYFHWLGADWTTTGSLHHGRAGLCVHTEALEKRTVLRIAHDSMWIIQRRELSSVYKRGS